MTASSIPTGLPTVFLPGQPQFTSYKSTLNELFNRKKCSLPIYEGTKDAEKQDDPWTCMVSYPKPHFSPDPTDPSKVQATFSEEKVEVMGKGAAKKPAEQRAAFEALKTLKLLPGNAEFLPSVTTGNKRKAEGMDVDGAPSSSKSPKHEGPDTTTYKTLLQKQARKGIPVPEYRTVEVDKNFFSTVAFNGVDYKGTFARQKKQAEHNAAQMALYVLGHEPSPPEGYNKDTDVPPKGTTKGTTSTVNASAQGNGESGFAMPPPQLVQQSQLLGTVINAMPYHHMQMPPQQILSQQKPISTQQLDSGDYKGMLMTYMQRQKFEPPAYNTSEVASGGFIASVTVAGMSHSGVVCPKKRSADMSAAHFALYFLKQTPVVPTGFQEKCTNGVAPIEKVTKPINDKQKLHQFCQKEKLGSVAYESTIRPDNSAISTVTIGMRHYTGAVASNKKLAEQNAAAEACSQMMAASS